MGKHARVLEPAHVRRVLKLIRQHRHSERDTAMVLLSFKAGLRAGEIAGLDWRMVLRADGKVGAHINVESGIAKKGSGRRIPINPELKRALERLHKISSRPLLGAIIRSERNGHMHPRSVVNWFASLYRTAQLDGCSSHSGRRTFITRSARVIAKSGGSLRDIQLLAGHRSIETTQSYIDGDGDAQRRLVRMI